MNAPTPPIAHRRLANALRMLAVDAVEQANSGHPGAPMGMADIAEVLWRRHLRHDPADPHWPDRDRFVLSNGHGSMLLYGLLHLTGYALPMDELRCFRQLHSKTPGHPEVGLTPGVETTTGPLGQGLANAVGMALAEKLLAAAFNRPGHAIVDHSTYAFVGDGCLMEGISHEACSLAGTLRLSKLVVVYDDNGISIDGDVRGWFRDDTPRRFEAYGWHVIAGVDGHDAQAVHAALEQARAQARQPDGRPTLVCCRTVIGEGAPTKAGGHDVHGAPLGAAEVAATRTALDWTAAPFQIPPDIAAAWDARERGARLQADWQTRLAAYRAEHPALAAEFERRMAGELPQDFLDRLPALLAAVPADAVATRKGSQRALDALAPLLPELFGGSADLTASNLTNFKGCVPAGRDQAGNHLSWGVREFGMAAALNGMALHGGFIPYGGTFLTFSDYSRNAIRMAALMQLRLVHVFTHDSIGLGEDGPTHQSVEQVPSLRLIPGLDVWRPADGRETLVAWQQALQRADGPSALALSRQNLPALTGAVPAGHIERGGYVLADAAAPRAVILATGSELQLALLAHGALAAAGIATRVVSMPCTNVFDRQPRAWRDSVLPPHLPAVAVEAAHPDFWHKYVGREGRVIGIASFGESAPAAALYTHFGITAARVELAVRELLEVPV
ncbi:transketolase [Pseudorhodoferax sp. Leaf267]|uniref:transketolase n=1 Tax=Pseudorhodoferax sp. Leaf267 TaxID=1736316 RepID=UPI0006F9AA1C|nr:transketolase [Pseudorhodoferax sp. Leaf267]KQP14996.1 transketolase [Pseudorhodoferax sp. Leaf267]